jgi:4-hydroxybutyrate CoA-transferase
MGGSISSIVAQFEPGTVATVGRHYADYIVTEYGIAKLMNKNFRERANELIAIAHPDFREELRKEAQKLFWP